LEKVPLFDSKAKAQAARCPISPLSMTISQRGTAIEEAFTTTVRAADTQALANYSFSAISVESMFGMMMRCDAHIS
jgi:hypothetical protein